MKRASFAAFFLLGCSTAANTSPTGSGGSSGTGEPPYVSGDDATTGTGSAGSGFGDTSTSAGTGGSTSSGMAGVLTAGIWDDNLNYTFFSGYVASKTSLPGDPGFTDAERDASHLEFAGRTPHAKIDAALVLDTTGSMGDELSYLTAEFANITGSIAAKYPNADQRWALVLYRDTPDHDPGDAYVVRSFDFTSDPNVFASELAGQSADGGGDIPESPELGLEALAPLSWRTDPSVARVAFGSATLPNTTTAGRQCIKPCPVCMRRTSTFIQLRVAEPTICSSSRCVRRRSSPAVVISS